MRPLQVRLPRALEAEEVLEREAAVGEVFVIKLIFGVGLCGFIRYM